MSGNAHNFNNNEMRAFTKIFFLQGKEPRKIHAILTEMVKDMHHRMPPSNIVWPSLNVVILTPVLRLVLDDSKQWPPRTLLITFSS